MKEWSMEKNFLTKIYRDRFFVLFFPFLDLRDVLVSDLPDVSESSTDF